MTIYKEVKKCRICNNSNLVEVLNLGVQKLTGVFPSTKDELVPEGPLVLMKCHGQGACELVQLKHTYNLESMYGDNYGYRSGLNASMVKHLKSIVEEIENNIPLNDDDLILDIGSNDSTLLSAYSNRKMKFLGIDPSAEKFKKYYPKDVELITDFFPSPKIQEFKSQKDFKIITSISMFYDLEDPINFAREIRKNLSSKGVWIIEQSYLPFMLQTKSFDTVCHEHIEFYAIKQIEWIAKETDLKIIRISTNDTNGGSFRVHLTHKDSEINIDHSELQMYKSKENAFKLDSLDTWQLFEKNIHNEIEKLTTFLKSNNSLCIGTGASTKGNVYLQYAKITEKEIPFISEVNEDKFEKFTPGTKIPIISEKKAEMLNPSYKLIIPWHFKEFFINKEQEFLNKGGKLVFALPHFEIISQ